MNIVAFILFGLINGLLFHTLDNKTQKNGIVSAIVLGILGAFTGGSFAYFLFGGNITQATPILSIVIALEVLLLGALFLSSNSRTVRET